MADEETAPVYTGTMGWSYEDWRGPFYEGKLPAAKMLEQYATIFPTVELDTTFYGVPRASTLRGWDAATPAGFRFSAKAPRAVTHERRLVGAVEAATEFGALLQQELGDKLGALLLQLPPDFTEADRRVMEEFATGLATSRTARGLPWVVEFRHASWRESGIQAFLDDRGILTATTEKTDLGATLRYLRLLGTENSVGRFDARQFDRAAEVATWAARIDAARREAPGSPIYVYVRNFFEGHAPATLFDLRERLGLPNVTPPGQQQMSLF